VTAYNPFTHQLLTTISLSSSFGDFGEFIFGYPDVADVAYPPLLAEVQNGSFKMLGPHGILRETALLIGDLEGSSYLTSDHYTNYINLEGKLPDDKPELLARIQAARQRDETSFRPFFVGTQ